MDHSEIYAIRNDLGRDTMQAIDAAVAGIIPMIRREYDWQRRIRGCSKDASYREVNEIFHNWAETMKIEFGKALAEIWEADKGGL